MVVTSFAARRSNNVVDLLKMKLYSSLTPYAMQISGIAETTFDAAAFMRLRARQSLGLVKE